MHNLHYVKKIVGYKNFEKKRDVGFKLVQKV